MNGWAVAAFLTGVAGVVTAWAGLVKTRNDGARNCDERLRDARAESEALAAELHAERMRNV